MKSDQCYKFQFLFLSMLLFANSPIIAALPFMSMRRLGPRPVSLINESNNLTQTITTPTITTPTITTLDNQTKTPDMPSLNEAIVTVFMGTIMIGLKALVFMMIIILNTIGCLQKRLTRLIHRKFKKSAAKRQHTLPLFKKYVIPSFTFTFPFPFPKHD